MGQLRKDNSFLDIDRLWDPYAVLLSALKMRPGLFTVSLEAAKPQNEK